MVQACEPVFEVIVATPIYNMYLRLLGATVSTSSQVYTPFVTEFDLISIGKGSTIGEVRSIKCAIYSVFIY